MRLAEGQVRPQLADHDQSLAVLLGDPDCEKADGVLKAILEMKKIQIKALSSAYNG